MLINRNSKAGRGTEGAGCQVFIPDITTSSGGEWRQALECQGCVMNVRTKWWIVIRDWSSLKSVPWKTKRWKKQGLVLLTIPSHPRRMAVEQSWVPPHRLTLKDNVKLVSWIIDPFSSKTALVVEQALTIFQLTFPFCNVQLMAFEGLVITLRFGLIIWIVVLGKVRVG